eukprot:2700635-Rhodomonas_salina.2
MKRRQGDEAERVRVLGGGGGRDKSRGIDEGLEATRNEIDSHSNRETARRTHRPGDRDREAGRRRESERRDLEEKIQQLLGRGDATRVATASSQPNVQRMSEISTHGLQTRKSDRSAPDSTAQQLRRPREGEQPVCVVKLEDGIEGGILLGEERQRNGRWLSRELPAEAQPQRNEGRKARGQWREAGGLDDSRGSALDGLEMREGSLERGRGMHAVGYEQHVVFHLLAARQRQLSFRRLQLFHPTVEFCIESARLAMLLEQTGEEHLADHCPVR